MTSRQGNRDDYAGEYKAKRKRDGRKCRFGESAIRAVPLMICRSCWEGSKGEKVLVMEKKKRYRACVAVRRLSFEPLLMRIKRKGIRY